MDNPVPLEKLPCGCEVGTAIIDGKNTLVYKPCSMTCEYYVWTMNQSNAQGNSLEFATKESIARRDIQPGGLNAGS